MSRSRDLAMPIGRWRSMRFPCPVCLRCGYYDSDEWDSNNASMFLSYRGTVGGLVFYECEGCGWHGTMEPLDHVDRDTRDSKIKSALTFISALSIDLIGIGRLIE